MKPVMDYKRVCKEMINIPLVSGLISIILTIIPYVNTFVTRKDWVFYKTLVGWYIFK